LGVLGFSLLFDTQPRPISVDIPIEIPAKNAVLPIQAAKPVQPSSPAASVEPTRPVPSAGAVAGVSTNDSLSAREEVVDSVPATTQPAKTVVKPEKQPEPVIKPPAQKPDPAKVSAAEAARVQALLDGKPPVAVERIVVQVGAFADAARAQEVRLTLERAGLKTYTHVAETSEGKRIRVRLGPFASRAEADKAAVRVKALGLPAAILTL